jgi:LysR family pca operon transcriptional activator
VLEALDASAQAVAPAAGGRIERLRIGALPSVAPALLPVGAGAAARGLAAVQIVVKSAANAALLDELRAGELDLVVGRMSDPRLMGGLSFELLHTEPLVFAVRAGHPLAAMKAVSVQAVLAYPLVVYGEGTIPRHNTESFLSARGLVLPTHALQTLDVALARALVAVSDAVWITPLGAARGELADGRLVRLRIDTAGTEEPVGLLQRSDAEPSALRAAMAALLREAAKQQGALPREKKTPGRSFLISLSWRGAVRRPHSPRRRAGGPARWLSHIIWPRHSIASWCACSSEPRRAASNSTAWRMPRGWSMEHCSLIDRCIDKCRNGFSRPFDPSYTRATAASASARSSWYSGCSSIHPAAMVSSASIGRPWRCLAYTSQKKRRTSSWEGLNIYRAEKKRWRKQRETAACEVG